MRSKTVLFFVLLCLPLTGFAYNHQQALFWVASHVPQGSALLHHQQVADVYAANQFQPIWYQYKTLQAFETRLEFIALADVSDHFYQRLLELKQARQQNRWQEYDVLATDTLLSYISYAENSPELGKGWFFGGRVEHIPDPSVLALEELKPVIQSDNLLIYINQLDSANKDYDNYLIAAQAMQPLTESYLAKYRQNKRLLRRGDKMSFKPELVARLQSVGIDVAAIDGDNGWFDKELEHAVIAFQKLHGLKPDGVIGPKTQNWINKSVENRIRLVALNAQRLRIWPTQRDHIILVNIPQYEMAFWRGGEQVFESNVIVGRPSRKTPLIDTRMNAVILNPGWNVPRKIMVKDILPKAFDSVEYLSEHNYEIVRSWQNREVLDPQNVDWDNLSPNSFPYRLRQTSGPYNALGRYKFNTPNKNAIFLHDTPAKNLFNEHRRAFSSGCIRVERSAQLADFLMAELAVKPVDPSSLEPSETKSVSLRQRIPVHIIYQTAWIEQGQVQYRDDVYKYDFLSKSSNFDAKMTKIVDLNKLLTAQ
ncbi:L,D-transpeptidase family protein [Vibrio sp. SCSIO 43136]|uniref:L,D-transpeptidase family protein n=1 Tax=Vibrio sp. SCSIO 43136 TaxID=2819101 RepID=UPI00207608D4|nr:L,D-transpeptidase family protein [Vibrio sp. SCSIO 43136]USD66393.1 L,D-transpeptidase family protein [Vibrio sp. SCSIO 43136]